MICLDGALKKYLCCRNKNLTFGNSICNKGNADLQCTRERKINPYWIRVKRKIMCMWFHKYFKINVNVACQVNSILIYSKIFKTHSLNIKLAIKISLHMLKWSIFGTRMIVKTVVFQPFAGKNHGLLSKSWTFILDLPFLLSYHQTAAITAASGFFLLPPNLTQVSHLVKKHC